MDKVEEFLESVEELFFNSVNYAAPDLSTMPERLQHLWTHFTRYGPVGMPQLMDRLPSLGDFEIPPPPPPPPPPPSLYERSVDWIEKHPWKAGGVAAGVVGATLLAGYGGVYMRAARLRRLKDAANGRRQVVVILGGDTPLGIPLVHDLERKGYIVIASVSSPEAADDLERRSRGFVRALVLDPTEPAGIPVFFRSMASTLTRKFPLNSAGDPFDSSSLTVHSVISLLGLVPPPAYGPLENINLDADLVPYLNATLLTPLRAIQDILPLFRNFASGEMKNIIFCLPATSARVGLPFSAMQSMTTASALRAAEVLRREIAVAALTGKSEGMKSIKVKVVEVGAFNVDPAHQLGPDDVYKSMEPWTASEKLAYGAGFAAISHHAVAPRSRWDSVRGEAPYGVRRKPTDVKVFVDNIASVVSNGRLGPLVFGYNIGLGRVRNLILGDRFSLGAGSSTYKYASLLPSLVLDAVLNLPHFLVSTRNALVHRAPHVPVGIPVVESRAAPAAPEVMEVEHHSDNASETGSEADVESNAGDTTQSWVRLHKSETEI